MKKKKLLMAIALVAVAAFFAVNLQNDNSHEHSFFVESDNIAMADIGGGGSWAGCYACPGWSCVPTGTIFIIDGARYTQWF